MCVFIILQYKHTTFIKKVILRIIHIPQTFLIGLEIAEQKEIEMSLV